MGDNEKIKESLREKREEAFIKSLEFVQGFSNKDDDAETDGNLPPDERAIEPPIFTVKMGKNIADIFARALAAYNEVEELDDSLMTVMHRLRQFATYSNGERQILANKKNYLLNLYL